MIFKRLVYVLGFLLFIWHHQGYAQDCTCKIANEQYIDSLINVGDSLKFYQTIEQLKQSKNIVCAAIAYDYEINFWSTKLQFEKVLELIKKQEKFIGALECKEQLNVHTLVNYTWYYKITSNYEMLSYYGFRALKSAEDFKEKELELEACKYLLSMFILQNQDDKITEYITRGENIIKSLPPSFKLATHYNWLGFNKEQIFFQTKNEKVLDTMIFIAEKAITIARQYNDMLNITNAFRIKETAHYHNQEYNLSSQNSDSILYYARLISSPKNIAPLFINKAWNLVELKKNMDARMIIDSIIYYNDQNFKPNIQTANVYFEISQLYEEIHEKELAFDYFKKYNNLKDSLFSMERSEKINELEQKYFKEKNEKKIQQLSWQRKLFIFGILLSAFLITSLLFLYQRQKLKHKTKILETEQRLNRARMNPHFFFNALSSFQYFILKDDNKETLASNLSKFSHIMRETLESTYKEFVTIEQEITFLEEYLSLQQIRIPNQFDYTIQYDESMPIDELQIPSMILQPFIENSIEHGFKGIEYKGKISIYFFQEEKDIIIKIQDNGKGLTETINKAEDHISRANQIIKERIYLLNLKLKTRAHFNIENNKKDKGVNVSITLPELYDN
ncbi:MAG: histidine kinase [Chitinophagaceae bacterium]